MTWGAVAVGGATVLAAYMTAEQQAQAQRDANKENTAASAAQTAEQRRQFDIGSQIGEERYSYDVGRVDEMSTSRRAREDEINRQMQGRFDEMRGESLKRLDPYSSAGSQAMTQQQALLGLSGKEAQAEAYGQLSESPGQAFLRERQERALLRSSAAIGGLGGGNVRTALQEQAFGRSQTDIDRQVERLGAITGQGLTASQEAARLGDGPSYVQTGQDIGVGATGYTPSTVIADQAAPAPAPAAEPAEPQTPAYNPWAHDNDLFDR